MRTILTGQVGLDKKEYLDEVAEVARRHGTPLSFYHVGDRMYAEASDVSPGRILDLPLSRLHSIRRSVFKDIIVESAGQENVIVNTHATFRWRHGLFRAFDFDQIERFRPDAFISLVDNVESVHARLKREHTLDATLKDTLVWREEEILATELLALATDCSRRCFVMPRGRYTSSAEKCFHLACNPEVRKVYLSFPMSHVVDMPDVMEEIDAFRARIRQHFVTFDPADVDEKQLVESSIRAAKEGRDFVEGRSTDRKGNVTTFPVSVKQVLEVTGDIDGQIYARDFQLIDQSDMIVSLVPALPSGVPALSSGVERELHHAYEHGKEVYVIWKPLRAPSPFITETATDVFRSAGEALEHFKSTGVLKPPQTDGEEPPIES
jgi:hypothetical protein